MGTLRLADHDDNDKLASAGSLGSCSFRQRGTQAAAGGVGNHIQTCNLVFIEHNRKAGKKGGTIPSPLLLCKTHACVHAATPSNLAGKDGNGSHSCIIHGAAGLLQGPCSCHTTAADADPTMQSVAAVSSLFASYLAQEYRAEVCKSWKLLVSGADEPVHKETPFWFNTRASDNSVNLLCCSLIREH